MNSEFCFLLRGGQEIRGKIASSHKRALKRTKLTENPRPRTANTIGVIEGRRTDLPPQEHPLHGKIEECYDEYSIGYLSDYCSFSDLLSF